MNGVRGHRWLGWGVLLLGFAFLYLPILLLMLYSFNASRLATVWAGFSTQWYGELLRDRQLLDAAWVSVKVAFWTASASSGRTGSSGRSRSTRDRCRIRC